MTSPNPKSPSVGVATVFERRNRNGERYLAGRWGQCRILIMATGEVSKGERIWRVYLGEAPYTDDAMRGGIPPVED